jgi:excisionase family DNA binding protein
MDAHLMTVNEVAERVRVNPRTVRRWIDAGKLRAAKVMGGVRVEARELDNLVKEARPKIPAAKNLPDRNTVLDRIERMLASDPHPSSSESISELIDDVRKGREDAILGRH